MHPHQQAQGATEDPLDFRGSISTQLASRLVAAQFPHWAHLTVSPVSSGGWDNLTFHLGDEMSVRLPSGPGYAAQVDKESRWLPYLARYLPLPVPTRLAKGRPGDGYPFDWSVNRWLDGESALTARIEDQVGLGTALADFLQDLHLVDPTGGPPTGEHNFFRGGPLSTYDVDTRRAIEILADRVDTGTATEVWEAALASSRSSTPVWVHGDFAAGNLLILDGRLSAVIDFGCMCVGDPACDLAIAWTLLTGDGREAFRAGLRLDPGTWARGRGWTLWKALITISGQFDSDPAAAGVAQRVLDEVLAEHRLLG